MSELRSHTISTSRPHGWSEMVDALLFVLSGLEAGHITSKLVLQFPPPGGRRRVLQVISLEYKVKKALKAAGVKVKRARANSTNTPGVKKPRRYLRSARPAGRGEALTDEQQS